MQSAAAEALTAQLRQPALGSARQTADEVSLFSNFLASVGF